TYPRRQLVAAAGLRAEHHAAVRPRLQIRTPAVAGEAPLELPLPGVDRVACREIRAQLATAVAVVVVAVDAQERTSAPRLDPQRAAAGKAPAWRLRAQILTRDGLARRALE